MKKIIWITIFLLLASTAFSQQIIRVTKNLALIDTDQGIGKIGDERAIYRLVNGEARKIGALQLLRFQNGRAAARIIQRDRKFQIKVGDLLTPPIQSVGSPPTEQPNPLLQGRQFIIERVVSGYALISGAQGLGRVNETLPVSRLVNGQVIRVGKIKIIKFASGKTAVKVVQESPDHTMRAGDFILKLQKSQPDLDTYFYGAFRPEV